MVVLERARVCIGERKKDADDQAVAELPDRAPGKVEGKATDVRDSDQVAEQFGFIGVGFGGLDLLVDHAGAGDF